MFANPPTFTSIILVTTFLSTATARPLATTATVEFQYDVKSMTTNSNLEPRTQTESKPLGIAPKVLMASWPVVSPLIELIPTEYEE
ncbi:hypothetical protein TMatcc_009066 [Talaromyces marneffei ATCC 18224]|uniref:uncharacterized protein n=1 Tax=Talaromyces marneffei TaxID=37727 RepID=UPI0012AA95D0|nr:uncharacterized protein EYB26_008360 [Talaromyces marneffei]KAE8550991.1 hypothetical protein EYB25_007223 [Talaromyces marneffei]QGA20654.1 hypothetical protein EYB26_008360 [Talaromyces marneffei]